MSLKSTQFFQLIFAVQNNHEIFSPFSLYYVALHCFAVLYDIRLGSMLTFLDRI